MLHLICSALYLTFPAPLRSDVWGPRWFSTRFQTNFTQLFLLRKDGFVFVSRDTHRVCGSYSGQRYGAKRLFQQDGTKQNTGLAIVQIRRFCDHDFGIRFHRSFIMRYFERCAADKFPNDGVAGNQFRNLIPRQAGTAIQQLPYPFAADAGIQETGKFPKHLWRG